MLITSIFIILLFSILSLIITNKNNNSILMLNASITTGIVLLISLYMILSFDSNVNGFQHLVTYNYGSQILNFSYSFGLDGISIYFFFLTAFLIFFCVLFIWNDNNLKQYLLILLTIEFFLLFIFSILDLMLFYIFFEAILIPMFLMIGYYGSRERKVRAVYLFFYYTLCGSLFLLLGILYIYAKIGTFNLEQLIRWTSFTQTEELILWLAFFLSFASKIPMFPFHIWLPEAHVEAPTIGSVLLAGVLLKLGVYGFLRLSLTLFPYASQYYSPLIYLLSIISVIYASLASLRQTDLKRIIAYSSVAHMNLVTLGIFSFNSIGIEGSIIQSISHGFVAGGMFFLIGILYNRYHSRFVLYYSGLSHSMPIYATILLIFTLANIALPGTSSFTGEYLLLNGIFAENSIVGIVSAFNVIISGSYSLWLYNRIAFGNIKDNYTLQFEDISMQEVIIILPLIFFVILMGLYPSVFMEPLHLTVNNLLNKW